METRSGDVVLIHHQGKPVSYARVEDIVADVKPQWWQITLLLLSVPPQKVTWILREQYIDGGEFTMGGETMRIERLAPPQPSQPPEPKPTGGGEGKVVSLSQRRGKG